MTTRLYFHVDLSAEGGTLPTTEQSTKTSTADFDSQATSRRMDTTLGSNQTSLTLVRAVNDQSDHNYYVSRWISPELDQTSIAANTWTLNFAIQCTNVTAGVGALTYPANDTNDRIPITCYVWRPSTGTKVGNIFDGQSANVYYDVGSDTNQTPTTAESAEHGTFTGSAVASVQTGDVIILEAWVTLNTTSTTSVTFSWYYDGTTVTTTQGPTVSDQASFLETPENLTFNITGNTFPLYRSFSPSGFMPQVASRTF